MSSNQKTQPGDRTVGEGRRKLTPAAQRALAEAAERRTPSGADTARSKELHGRDGPEPVRYGDWEVKGLASDF